MHRVRFLSLVLMAFAAQAEILVRAARLVVGVILKALFVGFVTVVVVAGSPSVLCLAVRYRVDGNCDQSIRICSSCKYAYRVDATAHNKRVRKNFWRYDSRLSEE